MRQDTPRARFVRVASAEPVGPDSLVTVEDPEDPDWRPVTFWAPGKPGVGSGGYLRFVPGRSYHPRKPDGWAFRPAGEFAQSDLDP